MNVMQKPHILKYFVMNYTKHPFAFAYLIINDALTQLLRLNLPLVFIN
jgi:hypothetical protein